MTTDAEALALAEAAVGFWGGALQTPRLVKNRENIVFDVRLTGGQRVALRLHRPGYQSTAGIAAELGWMARLAAQGFPVPEPVAGSSGGWLTDAGGRAASCVAWLDGIPIGAAEQPLPGGIDEQKALFHAIGGLVAWLHNETDGGALPAEFARPAWDEEGLLGSAPLWGRFWENPAFTSSERDLINAARDRARGQMQAFRATGGDYGAIHADVLRENILRQDDRLVLIDFDDSGAGFRMFDLATAIVQSLEEPALPTLAAALLAGYGARRALPASAGRWLTLFVMLRTFASAGWILTRAGPDDPRQRFYAARALRMANHFLAGDGPFTSAE